MSVEISRHAAERYRDRVRPALSVAEARADLAETIARIGSVVEAAPEWLSRAEEHIEGTDGYLLLGEDIALPVANGFALTCLTRGELSPEAREKRNEWARKRRETRQMKRKKARRALRKRRPEPGWEGEAA